ncbi:MAG: hypothetical protein U0K87_00385 [Ruminococcus sp.]|nr:hypothetical protein [Acutalibacteraceae bacterium]MEE1170791.1 hypothetical protein [Ruminococcus sp.]
MKPENRNQMVRGVVAAGTRYSGLVTADPVQAEEHDCCVARTFWYRHDELDRVERALESLSRTYSKMDVCDSVMMYYEYKDYED